MELLQIPNPHSNKTCSCKSSIWRCTLSNSCHWFSLMCVFQFNRQFLWEKRCFGKQCVRVLACIPKRDLHLGKTYFFKQVFCCVLRSWYCLFLKVLRVRHLEKLFCCCLLAFCQLRELLRQNLCGNCCMSVFCFGVHVLINFWYISCDFAYAVEWGIFISSRSVSWFISWREDSRSVFRTPIYQKRPTLCILARPKLHQVTRAGQNPFKSFSSDKAQQNFAVAVHFDFHLGLGPNIFGKSSQCPSIAFWIAFWLSTARESQWHVQCGWLLLFVAYVLACSFSSVCTWAKHDVTDFTCNAVM